MAKDKTLYTCTECGGNTPKWQGKCPACGAWNTLIEGVAEAPGAVRNRFASLAPASEVAVLADIEAAEVPRTPTGIDELDRVLGGGIVEGGVILIGGDPGIGKSTLLLQALDGLQRGGVPTLYVTGEESGAQVALRSRRLGLPQSQVKVLAEIQLEKIQATIAAQRPTVAVIDSIQTVYSDQLTSAPGSVAQVRECAAHLTRLAKSGGTTIVLVGHVTKEGALAGPQGRRQSERDLPVAAQRTGAGQLRAGDAGRHAADAGGDPGAGGQRRTQPAPALRRPRSRSPRHAAGGAAPARRRGLHGPGRVRQRRRRRAHQRTGGRPGGDAGDHVIAARARAAQGLPGFR
jgi:hypothetical protein